MQIASPVFPFRPLRFFASGPLGLSHHRQSTGAEGAAAAADELGPPNRRPPGLRKSNTITSITAKT